METKVTLTSFLLGQGSRVSSLGLGPWSPRMLSCPGWKDNFPEQSQSRRSPRCVKCESVWGEDRVPAHWVWARLKRGGREDLVHSCLWEPRRCQGWRSGGRCKLTRKERVTPGERKQAGWPLQRVPGLSLWRSTLFSGHK